MSTSIITSIIVFLFAILLSVIAIGVSIIAWRQQRPDMKMVNDALAEIKKIYDQYKVLREEFNKMEVSYAELNNNYIELKGTYNRVESIADFLISFIATLDNSKDFIFPEHVKQWMNRKTDKESMMKLTDLDIDTIQLKKLLVEYFSPEDLKDLTYDLNMNSITYSTNKRIWIGEIIDESIRQKSLPKLVSMAQELRPMANWISIKKNV